MLESEDSSSEYDDSVKKYKQRYKELIAQKNSLEKKEMVRENYTEYNNIGAELVVLGDQWFDGLGSTDDVNIIIHCYDLAVEIGMWLFDREYKNNILYEVYQSFADLFYADRTASRFYGHMKNLITQDGQPLDDQYDCGTETFNTTLKSIVYLFLLDQDPQKIQHLKRIVEWGKFVLRCHEKNECEYFQNTDDLGLKEYLSLQENVLFFGEILSSTEKKVEDKIQERNKFSVILAHHPSIQMALVNKITLLEIENAEIKEKLKKLEGLLVDKENNQGVTQRAKITDYFSLKRKRQEDDDRKDDSNKKHCEGSEEVEEMEEEEEKKAEFKIGL